MSVPKLPPSWCVHPHVLKELDGILAKCSTAPDWSLLEKVIHAARDAGQAIEVDALSDAELEAYRAIGWRVIWMTDAEFNSNPRGENQ